jgi:hypothetical protein
MELLALVPLDVTQEIRYFEQIVKRPTPKPSKPEKRRRKKSTVYRDAMWYRLPGSFGG